MESKLSNITKWDIRFLKLAEHVATWSKDPSTKVGAVIVNPFKRVVSLGYNGFPAGTSDDEALYNDRAKKYERIVHGEMNAILFAKGDLFMTTLYTVPFMPCSRCAAMIIQAGIVRVVAPFNDNPRWIESFKLTEELFNEAGVKLDLHRAEG